MPILSIVICTYNRSEWLFGCLSSLEPQCQDNEIEVLIIDNNSSDSTSSVANQFTSRLANFRYVFEESQGLSYARNRGIEESSGEIVAYLDDDTRVAPGWVRAVLEFFRTHANASGVGGQHQAFSVVPIPKWFPEEYGSRSLGEETRLLRPGEWISGLNMAFRRKALVEIGGFDTSIGMNGEKVSYGEETQLTLRMIDKGMKVYYCADMRVDHAILPFKLTLRWLLHSSYANGYDGVSTFNYSGTAINYVPQLFRSFKQALWKLVGSNEKYMKTRIYRSLAKLFWDIGFFIKLVGL